MSLVERYHEPLWRAVSILQESFTFDEALQAAVNSINECTGPDGLVPTLLVFGALPSLETAQDTPHPDIAKSAAAVAKSTKLMSAHFMNEMLPTPRNLGKAQTKLPFAVPRLARRC